MAKTPTECRVHEDYKAMLPPQLRPNDHGDLERCATCSAMWEAKYKRMAATR